MHTVNNQRIYIMYVVILESFNIQVPLTRPILCTKYRPSKVRWIRRSWSTYRSLVHRHRVQGNGSHLLRGLLELMKCWTNLRAKLRSSNNFAIRIKKKQVKLDLSKLRVNKVVPEASSTIALVHLAGGNGGNIFIWMCGKCKWLSTFIFPLID